MFYTFYRHRLSFKEDDNDCILPCFIRKWDSEESCGELIYCDGKVTQKITSENYRVYISSRKNIFRYETIEELFKEHFVDIINSQKIT